MSIEKTARVQKQIIKIKTKTYSKAKQKQEHVPRLSKNTAVFEKKYLKKER
jgi:hypothetical protein